MMRNKAPKAQSTKRRSQTQMKTSNPTTLNPGDEAAPGTPGTGDDICPECQGKGRIGASVCPNCGGGGTITRAIGGA